MGESFFSRSTCFRRVVHIGVLCFVVLLSTTLATFVPRAATPAPAPVRHLDGPTIAPTIAPSRAAPRATDAITPTLQTLPTLPPPATPLPTVPAHTVNTPAVNPETPATATSTATPNPAPAPHTDGPQENHPRVPTHPTAPPFVGTVSPLPSRHPDGNVPPMSAGPPITRPDVARGIQYTSWWHGEYASNESDLTLAQKIAPLGVNWLAPIVTCYSQTITSTVIDCTGDQTPTDADLTHLIASAHALGIKVMLKPHVDLQDPNHWRGEISMGTNAIDWGIWFSNYTAYITHYAALAQSAGVDMFVVGTELEGTSGHAAAWRQVVAAVRTAYSGPITYAANHGEEVSVTWWDTLDSIGVDAYYPLTSASDPTVAQLKAAWAPTVSLLATLSTTYQKPIIFTEVGYQSQAGTNITPWNVTSGVLDLQEQTDCYTALLEVFRDLPWWHGVFWWSATPYRDQGGITDMDFTPINKPAQEVIRGFYGGDYAGTPGPVGTPRPAPARH